MPRYPHAPVSVNEPTHPRFWFERHLPSKFKATNERRNQSPSHRQHRRVSSPSSTSATVPRQQIIALQTQSVGSRYPSCNMSFQDRAQHSISQIDKEVRRRRPSSTDDLPSFDGLEKTLDCADRNCHSLSIAFEVSNPEQLREADIRAQGTVLAARFPLTTSLLLASPSSLQTTPRAASQCLANTFWTGIRLSWARQHLLLLRLLQHR